MTSRIAWIGAAAFAVSATVAGQTALFARAEQERRILTPDAQMRTPLATPEMRQAVVESRVTTGRPYSAEATTEFSQVLGDGNRIVRKATVRIFRDGEGRTRREELDADGQVKSISIYDPVVHASYVLDPARRVATKSALRVVVPDGRGRGGAVRAVVGEKITAEQAAAERVPGRVMLGAPAEAPGQAAAEGLQKVQAEIVARSGGGGALQPAMRGRGSANANTESLGQKTIDGVLAEGTRTTSVIPAGSIGNQQPITVTSEQWFSPDLEILVMTKFSDPRSGESSYTVSNITRGEPTAGLFDVPSDYTITESSYMRSPALR